MNSNIQKHIDYLTKSNLFNGKLYKIADGCSKSLIIKVTFLLIITSNLQAVNNSGYNQTIYMSLVREYADAMITHARDVYGNSHSPLFASALDRDQMRLDKENTFHSIPGVRENDRSLRGANVLVDVSLFDILYKLTEVTGEEKYTEEADEVLKYFFNNCQSEYTGLMCWGEHLHWDFFDEKCGYLLDDIHEADSWPFMDKWYELAPEGAWKYVIGEWDHQVADKKTGDFSRHAGWSSHIPEKGSDFPRYAGQMIERWADAYQRNINANRDRREELLTAIEVLVSRMEQNMSMTATGYLPAMRGVDYVWPTSNLELARCLIEASNNLPVQMADRLRSLALKQDSNFLRAPHLVQSSGGFAVTLHSETGIPRERSMNKPYTISWSVGYGYFNHAHIANVCYGRYCQLVSMNPYIANIYKELVLTVANQYLVLVPDTNALQKPDTYADVIDLMINSYYLTGNRGFLQRADFFAQIGLLLFVDKGIPIPKATNKHNHYESITGGPAFMMALLKLGILI
jgi:hypothetical protein